MSHTETEDAGIGPMLVSARSFDEYVAMFALRDDDLTGTVLDCPAGASSFTATARARGIDVIACDIAYGDTSALAATARAETIRGNSYIAQRPERFAGSFFRDAEHHLEHRLASVERFAEDLRAHPESYIPGALPALPFPDGSFDLVLSSHLLFTYADRFDVDDHDRYLAELLRVSAREVRVFPLVPSGRTDRYAELGELHRRLDVRGVEHELRSVAYEFQGGGTEMLVCSAR
ncbi:class I SAM-dependent methyltransferase [Rhodococcus hoagii]|nr:class I SAM-dependent methyltransferase [Prescottella equi]